MQQLYQSKEAVEFQRQSPLAVALVKLFQDIIDYRNSIQDSVKSRVKKTRIYAIQQLNKHFPKIVKSTTGLNCLEIHTDPPEKLGYCSWACNLHLGDKYGLNADVVIEAYSGTGMSKYYESVLRTYDMHVVTVEDLFKLVHSLNTDTGIYSVDTLYDGRKVGFNLIWPIDGSFLLKEVCHEKCMEMTAEELAACAIHEIGHMHSMLEHALDGYCKTQAVITACDYFSEHASDEEKIKLTKALVQDVSPESKPAVDQALEKRTDSGSAKFKDNCHAAFTLLFNAAKIIIIPFWLIRQMFSYAGQNMQLAAINRSLDKLSDQRVSVHNFKICERLADQFTVRHGMGAYNASALRKMEYNEDVHLMGANGYSYKSSAMWNANVLTYFMRKISRGDRRHYNSHDDDVRRPEILLQETIEVFKQNNLPPDMLNYYVQQCDMIIKLLDDKPTSIRIGDHIDTFMRALRYVAETPSALFANGRFAQEYEELIYKIKKLNDNKLYYRAAKLQQLLIK